MTHTFPAVREFLLQQTRNLSYETAWAVWLRGETVVSVEKFSEDGNDHTVSTPSVSDLGRMAKDRGASHLIIAHNHPNGVAFPSEGDIETAFSYQAALPRHGLRLWDAWVLGNPENPEAQKWANAGGPPLRDIFSFRERPDL